MALRLYEILWQSILLVSETGPLFYLPFQYVQSFFYIPWNGLAQQGVIKIAAVSRHHFKI